MRLGVLLFAALGVLGACGAVVLPREHYYRIVPPQGLVESGVAGGVLRLEGLELNTSLTSDRILVASSPVELHAYEFHRWVSPLDRMVEDTLFTALVRSRAFKEVKGPAACPGEDLLLSGRILDFHQVHQGGRSFAKVNLALRLYDRKQEKTLIQDEFRALVPLLGNDPAAVAQGLSKGLAKVTRDLLARCVAVGALRAQVHAGPTGK